MSQRLPSGVSQIGASDWAWHAGVSMWGDSRLADGLRGSCVTAAGELQVEVPRNDAAIVRLVHS